MAEAEDGPNVTFGTEVEAELRSVSRAAAVAVGGATLGGYLTEGC